MNWRSNMYGKGHFPRFNIDTRTYYLQCLYRGSLLQYTFFPLLHPKTLYYPILTEIQPTSPLIHFTNMKTI